MAKYEIELIGTDNQVTLPLTMEKPNWIKVFEFVSIIFESPLFNGQVNKEVIEISIKRI